MTDDHEEMNSIALSNSEKVEYKEIATQRRELLNLFTFES